MKNNLITYKKSGVDIRSVINLLNSIKNNSKKKRQKSLIILVVLDL